MLPFFALGKNYPYLANLEERHQLIVEDTCEVFRDMCLGLHGNYS